MSQPPIGLSTFSLWSDTSPGSFKLPGFAIARLREIVDAAEAGTMTVDQVRLAQFWFDGCAAAELARAEAS